MTTPDRDRLDFLVGQVDARLTAQAASFDGLDRKATTILAASGVLLGLAIDTRGVLAGSAAAADAYSVGLLALAASLGAGVAVLWTQDFDLPPKPREFLDDAFSAPVDTTLGTLLTVKRDAFELNDAVNRRKDTRLRVQMGALAIAGVLLILAHLLVREV